MVSYRKWKMAVQLLLFVFVKNFEDDKSLMKVNGFHFPAHPFHVKKQVASSKQSLFASRKNPTVDDDEVTSKAKKMKSDDKVTNKEKKMKSYFGDATLCTSTFIDLYSNSNNQTLILSSPSENTNTPKKYPDVINDSSLPLPIWLTHRLHDLGYTHPTLIQKRTLDTLLLGESYLPNIIIQAQTGSGKTLSYLLPALKQIDASRSAIQALIIVPTRELGLQVSRVAKRLAAASSDQTSARGKIMVMSVLQGSQNKRQRAWAWAEPPHLVIGTPNELLKMASKGGMRTNSIKVVVVDEVDACLGQNQIQAQMQIQTQKRNTAAMSPKKMSSKEKNASYNALHTLLSRHLSPTYDEGENIQHLNINQNAMIAVSTPLADITASPSSSSLSNTIQKHRQTIFASATIPQHHHFIQQCIQNQWITNTNQIQNQNNPNYDNDTPLSPPIHIQVTPGELIPPTLKHGYIVCSQTDKKMAGLRRFVKRQVLSQRLNTSNTTIVGKAIPTRSQSCKILIFCEPHRPMQEMATVLAHDLGGIVWSEKHSQLNGDHKSTYSKDDKTNKNTNPKQGGDDLPHPYDSNNQSKSKNNVILSVLRMEDSLTGRAAAMNAFSGDNAQYQHQQKYQQQQDHAHHENHNNHDEEHAQNDKDVDVRILFSTDLAARGLDVDDISHVIHFDLPNDGDTYIHRSGRAGRMGKKGMVVSFITYGQEFVLERLVNKLGLQIKCLGRQKNQGRHKKRV